MAALTTANGVNSTKRAAILAGTSGVGSFIDGANEFGTKMRVCYDSYVVPTGDTAAAGFVITAGRVPEGARVIGFQVTNSQTAAAVTADLQLVDSDGNITQATAAEAWTDMTTAQGLFIPALQGVQLTRLDEEHTVTVTTAAQAMAAAEQLTVNTLYILED